MASSSCSMEDLEEEEMIAEKPYVESSGYSIEGNSSLDFEGTDKQSDNVISGIEKQIDEVGEMISKEEENYAVLQKKINYIEEDDYISELESKEKEFEEQEDIYDKRIVNEYTVEADVRNVTAEEWLDSLVPDLRKHLMNDEISEEKDTEVNEEIVSEAAKQAKEEMILDEDNPLVKKFQVVLRDHLLRQIAKLKTSVIELESDYKKKESILKEDAENAYKLQQIIFKQRENLENYKYTIEQVGNQRLKIENDIKIQDKECEDVRKAFEDQKVQLGQFQGESSMLAELVKKMSEYDKEQEKEIQLSKKMQNINIKDKEKLSKEKQAQDMLLWKYQKKLLEQKREIDVRLKKCKMKSEECQVLSSRLLQATIERAGLLMENQAISKELQITFYNIKQIDQTLKKTKDDLEEAKTNWAKLKLSLKWYKKSIKCLMEQNEVLLEERRKVKDDYQFLTDKIETIKEKEKRALEELNAFEELMKTAERDLYEAVQIGHSLKADEDVLMKKIAKATSDKAALEKAYIEKLTSVERTDKQVKKMSDLLSKMVEEHKKQELKMNRIENEVAKLMAEMESMKGILREIDEQKEAINVTILEAEHALKKFESDLKPMKETEIKLKNSVFEKKKELEKLESMWKHKTYLDSPSIKKKKKLTENIKKLQKSIHEKEKVWVELQEGCLRATQKRNAQLEKISTYRKQLGMLDASLQRSAQQMREEKQELRQIMGELKAATHNLQVLHDEELKQGEAKCKAETLNRDREDEFIALLKDLEKTILNIQQEIWDLEEANQEKTESVKQLQNELLEWNKKYNLAIEMKREIETEKSKSGEIGAMKQEIHRMEVRYSSLRKAEERLITDLELCLSRRDAIVECAEAREKRAKACGISARAQSWRRTEETKSKLKTIIREVKELKKEKEIYLDNRKKLSEELEFWRNSVERLSESLVQLEHQIQEGQIHRHRTLEMTVMRQRKSKLLDDLRMGRYRVAATEDSLHKQEENVVAIRNALFHILNELKNDFPKLNLQLLQIENTISYDIDPDVD